ncbi:MAG: hypothetical protein ACKVRN_15340 [Pyrinomonadaceae bacterium]
MKNIVFPAAIIIAGFAAVIFLSDRIIEARPSIADGYEDTDLAINGSQMKGYALGMEGLLADFYYMRALQYIGDKIINAKSDFIDIENLRNLNPRLLYPLLDNATDLDPNFIEAYSYGSLVLPAIDPEKAIDLASKGINNNPNEWRLYQYLGYTYWRLKRYDEAAETYEKGAQIVESGPFMKMMAATMKTEGGSRETARAIYRQMYEFSDDEMVKLTAERKLQQFDSLDERELMDQALEDFQQKNGQCANSLHDILPTLMKLKLPGGREFRVDRMNNLVDPTGAPYLLDKKTCRSQIDAAKTGYALQQ